MRLSGRVAVVTGAARGIGAAVAERLAAEGAAVALLDTDVAAARRQAAAVGGEAYGCDVGSRRSVGSAFARILQDRQTIDVLVNVAGIWRHTPVLHVTDAQWDQVFAVNVKGILHCSQAAARAMRANGCGKIVNIASVAGFGGSADWSAYCASKAAAISLTQALARELDEAGVQVHVVCPGATRTDLLRQIEAAEPGSEFDWVHEPREVADAVAKLIVPWEQTDTGCVVTMKPVSSVLGIATGSD